MKTVIDLRVDPQCEGGARCDVCAGSVFYPRTVCPDCGCSVEWIDRHGVLIADYPPQTPLTKRILQHYGIKYFKNEADRKYWEHLTEECGGDMVARFLHYYSTKTKGVRTGFKGLKGLHTLLTKYGGSNGTGREDRKEDVPGYLRQYEAD